MRVEIGINPDNGLLEAYIIDEKGKFVNVISTDPRAYNAVIYTDSEEMFTVSQKSEDSFNKIKKFYNP